MAHAHPVEPFFFLKLGPLSCSCTVGGAIPDDCEFVAPTNASRLETDEPPAELRNGGRFFDAGSGGSTSPQKFPGRGDSCESTGGSAVHVGHALPEGDLCAAFSAAVHSGRVLEAQRLMGACKEEDLDEGLVERVRRVTAQHKHSKSFMDRQIESFEIHDAFEELRLIWGFELVGDMIRIVYCVDEPELDLVRCFALSQERDLHMLFNKSLNTALQLGEIYPNDCVWNTKTESKTIRQKFDNLAFSSSIDALDEANDVWAIQYWPPPGPTAWDDKYPPIDDQHFRVPYSLYATKLSPADEGDRSKGFTLKIFVEAKLPPFVSKLASLVPRFLRRRLLREKVYKEYTQFRGIVEMSPELTERVQNSPRAPFYDVLRKRLS